MSQSIRRRTRAFAAGTVLTYTMSAQHFPKESVGRANSAFNLFHFAVAFGAQSAFGAIIAKWPRDVSGRYPPEAYKMAFLCLVAVQIPALLWFMQSIKVQREQLRGPLVGVVLPRFVAWGTLLYVGYHVLIPQRLSNKLALLTPVNPISVQPAGSSTADRLEARLQRIEFNPGFNPLSCRFCSLLIETGEYAGASDFPVGRQVNR